MAQLPDAVARAMNSLSGKQAEQLTTFVERKDRQLQQYKQQDALEQSLPGQVMTDVPYMLGAVARGIGERAAHRWGMDAEYRMGIPFVLGAGYAGSAAMGWGWLRQIAVGGSLPDLYNVSRGQAAREADARAVLQDELDTLMKQAA